MNFAIGIVAALGAGTLNGLFPLPMKAIKRWEWESVWLPFSILALVVFPLFIAWSFAPHLGTALLHIHGSDMVQALLCGAVVFTGSLMFGLAIPRIGAGLSFALLVGTMNAVGVLVPRILLHRAGAATTGDWLVVCGVAVSLASVAFGFWAGKGKTDAARDGSGATGTVGAVLAIAGGALSGVLPVGMSMPFASHLAHPAIRYGGADPSHAATVVITLVLFGGAIPNCLYCAYLLRSRGTYRNYQDSRSLMNWILVLCMGIFFSASNALWGIAISPYYLSALGPSIGWALFVGMIVASSTCMSLISGEWKETPRLFLIILVVSVVLLASSMILICAGTYRS